MSPDVSVIIVSFNTRELTLECLASVFAETRRPAEVFVVDNASRDGSADAIARRFPQVTLLRESTNLGFGAAVNVAAARARGRYLLLLNPDTRVLDGAIDRLVAFADGSPLAGIYGGSTWYPDGSPNLQSCWNRPTPWSLLCLATGLSSLAPGSRWFDTEHVALPPDGSAFDVDIVAGCLLLVRRDLWEQLGGFDPAFFMYGEDFDLCLRARRLGARPRVFPRARIVHHSGASERVAADRLVRLLRSKVLLFDRHWSSVGGWIGRASLLLWALTRRVGYRSLALAGRSGAADGAAVWDEVWRRAGEFLRGEPARSATRS